jgi:general stress protein YciG
MRKGFQDHAPEKRREIAAKGGRASGHRWTKDEAKAAGSKGGTVTWQRRRAATTPQQEMTDGHEEATNELEGQDG